MRHKLFKWSNIFDDGEWKISIDDFNSKKYSYFLEKDGIIKPIRFINEPYQSGYEFYTTVGFCDDNFTSDIVNVKHILDISELREVKLNKIGI